MTTTTDNSVSLEVQWPVIPPPLNDLTNNTGLHDIEDNNNDPSTYLQQQEKNDDSTTTVLHATTTITKETTIMDDNQHLKRQQSQDSLSYNMQNIQLNNQPSDDMDTTMNDHDDIKIPISPTALKLETLSSTSPTTLTVAQTPQQQEDEMSCDLTTSTTKNSGTTVPCKRTCDDSTNDYSGDTDVKRVRGDNNSISLSTSTTTTTTTASIPQPKEWCRRCGITETPRWRGGPLGRHTLCNACGLKWKHVGRPVEGYNNLTYPPPELPEHLRPRATQTKPRVPKPIKNILTTKVTKTLSSRTSIKKEKQSSPSPSLSDTESNNTKHTTTAIATTTIISTPDYDDVLLRKRKQFLIAGLYSSTYKELQLSTKGTSAKRPPRISWKKGLNNNNNNNEGGSSSTFRLSMPLFQGEFLLNTECDFNLPADILQEHYGGRLRQISNYTKIKTNIYVGRRPCKTDHQAAICQCEAPSNNKIAGCGEDCLNRMLFYECDPKTCPCEDKCTNRRFQQKKYITELAPFPTKHRGWGLRTLVPIPKGELITEYRGEVITHQMVKERMNTIYKGQQNFYFLDYGNGEVIDAGLKGSEARFINHSCDPNCHIEKWGLKGELFVGVFSSRYINAGEELFYDYNFSTFGESGDDQLCRCGSDNCRGTIGKKRRDNGV
ncbi:hypothetical protein INT45_014000 [Circinella minor]|uniref:SET domain-containing protein n=1 Tax=Circinella minor TaxID=1195481 RepID=A0A8H7VFQ5_9FUNG|nr:hypothetical protein INT45_014000 [Circinella minor]